MRKFLTILLVFLLTSCHGELRDFADSITCNTGFEDYRQEFGQKKPLYTSYKFVHVKEHGVISIHSQFDRLELFAVFKPNLKEMHYLAMHEKKLFGNNKETLILDCSAETSSNRN